MKTSIHQVLYICMKKDTSTEKVYTGNIQWTENRIVMLHTTILQEIPNIFLPFILVGLKFYAVNSSLKLKWPHEVISISLILFI